MSEEKIIKLLKSSITDDQLLGVTLAVSILGEDWCRKKFTIEQYVRPRTSPIVIEYKDFIIYFGNQYIEYVKKDIDRTRSILSVLSPHNIINYKDHEPEELSENEK